MSPVWTQILISIVGVLFTALLAATIASWRSTKTRLSAIDVELATLRQRMAAQDRTCGERLVWSRELDTKIRAVAEDTQYIRGKLDMHFQKK